MVTQQVYTQEEVDNIRKEDQKQHEKIRASLNDKIKRLNQTVWEQSATIETMRKYNDELLTRHKESVEGFALDEYGRHY